MTTYLPSVYFTKLLSHDGCSGFTNQIFSLVSSIVKALLLNKKAVAIDCFGLSYNSNETTNISSIIDLKKTNDYLKNKYNIVLLDKNTMQFTLHKAYYGVITSMFDITDEISGFVSKEDNQLFIPKNIVFNSLKGDPYPDFVKHFCMYYSLDNYYFFDNFQENLEEDICSNINSNICNFDFSGISLIKNMNYIFNDIFKNIIFTEKITPVELLNDNVFKMYNKINVIHLRLEEDALNHWCQQNNMERGEYKLALEIKYIELIKKYVQKDELNIILTYSSENPVLTYIKENGYPFVYINKNINKKQREVDAIKDLLLSTKCNNIFIGNFYIKTMKGSSFSYYILKKLELPTIKKIAISLDNIIEPEDVFY